ncbi:PREDICTED: uncharacterized protein LOC100640742 [Amphimedon queenslandica]|uniref:Uncharacterized protein n=1 Tax=Amphimedon queenslandica TaxID=400682 RepID=A0A1X7V929_AMPQE|nr:PREDICTED: uncharacterized protein LOC100640742 [Amphimedon queenslandica]|eukprot:XP_003385189.1 PREDICTED: uncharacterized protein LOC100640742 [Amphimedon queenslandica]
MPPKRKKRKVITYESWSKRRKVKRSSAGASSGKEISNSIQERRPIAINEQSSAPGAQPTKSSKNDTPGSEKENVYDTDESFDEEVWAEPVILPEPVSIKSWKPISSSTIFTFREIMESNVKESLRGLSGNKRKTAEKELREIITKVCDKLKDEKVPIF